MHATFNEVSKFLILKENDENDSGCVWNIPHSRFLLEKAVRPFALVMLSHVEVGWFFFEIQTLKLRPKWNMLVCHMLTLFCIGKMCEVQKSSRWKFDAGPLHATLCGSSKSGTLTIEPFPEIGSWCFIPFSAIEWWSDMSYIRSIWHNLPTSHKNQNHPTIIQQSWKTYHLKHILNIKPETWMHLPKVLPPAQPKTWSSTRSWRPGHPKKRRTQQQLIAAAVQLSSWGCQWSPVFLAAATSGWSGIGRKL